MYSQPWLTLLALLVICFGAAAIGSVFTSASVGTWCVQLQRPFGNPLNWILRPSWFAPFFMMPLTAWLVGRSGGWSGINVALWWFFAQLVLNATWSGASSGLRRPRITLLEIAFLIATTGGTPLAYLSFSRATRWLMTPYMARVCLACFLNCKIWQLNPGAA